MFTYLKRNSSYFAGALFCILISSIFAVALQFFKGDVLDYAVAGEVHAAASHAMLLFASIILECLFYFFYKRMSAGFIVRCTRQLKHDIFNSIIHRTYVAYKTLSQGAYTAKITNEADAIKTRKFSMLPLLWEILFKILFVSVALVFLDWRIALITIVLLTTPLYIPKLIEKRLQRVQSEYVKAIEEYLSKIIDWLSGFEIIKNFSIEHHIMKSFQQVNDASMEKLLHDYQLSVFAQLITTLISYFSYFIILAGSAWLVLIGDFSAGDFFIAIGMVDQLSYPLISLAEIIRQLVAITPICTDMHRFIKAPDEIPVRSILQGIYKEIRFRDVTFSYDSQLPLLKNFNLTIEKGKRYLLRGPSGCGKTTTINLLLRYYDVDSGCIEIDGVPIEHFNNSYDIITIVRQEAVLFHDTLRNNLTMYRDTPDKLLIELLGQLGLDKFANAKALDSIISENGANLSGGEKKRICLARALIRNTDVLVIDEPLANLDSDTVNIIEDLLLSIMGKTMLVVSHQFSEEKLRAFDEVVDFSLVK